MLGHIRALDVLDQLDYVKKDCYGAIGNSLGGSAVMYLAAFDERVKAVVASTGNSPKITNVYRHLTSGRLLMPEAARVIEKNGRIPWDVHEMIALIAPRAYMCLEPFNDPYNPYVETSIQCVLKATEVYKLLEEPGKISLYMHGDGYDTIDDVRELAYNWLLRFLKGDGQA